MATPVQITVTVDESGAVTGFKSIGNAATTMGQQTVTAGLKGAEAVAALTKQWEAEQAAIAQVNARIREHAAQQEAATAAVNKAATAFQGMTNEQMKANVAGRLLEQTLGIQNRAINQVISRSALLGPLMANMLPLGIFAAAVPMFVKIGEEIINATSDMAGYTDAVKHAREATVTASKEAFLNPKTIEFGLQHLAQLNTQITVLNKASMIETSRRDMMAEQATIQGKIVALLFAGSINSATSAALQAKAVALDEDRIKLIQNTTAMIKQMNDEVAKSQESTALIGKSGFSHIAQEHANAMADIAREFKLDPSAGAVAISAASVRGAAMVIDADAREAAQTLELKRQLGMETMKIQDQVTENALTGIAKIKQEEADHIKETLAEDVQKLGLSQAEVEKSALYQAQIARIHQDTNQRILASSVQTAAEIDAIHAKTRDTFLEGDDLILAQQSEAVSKVRAEYEKAPNPSAWEKYQAEIVLADAEAQKKIREAHQATEEQDAADRQKRALEITKLQDDQVNAVRATALASVPPWQKAYQQIYDAENFALNKIAKDQETLKAKYANDGDVLAQIDVTAQAERVRVYAEANEKINAENLRLTQQLGSELQSAFDDMTSGNIGKRILSNLEKFFFQIVAQWMLSLNIMKSAFGQLAGIALFGPQSTGANVLGGGGGGGSSLLGGILSLVGGGSSESAKVAAAGSSAGSVNVAIPGMVGGTTGGLSSAIAGTGATANSALVPSASNALTSPTMADAALPGLVGGTTSQLGGKSSLFGGLFSTKSLAALVPVAAMALGAAGGKFGMAGGLITSLLLTGKLGALIQPLTLGAGALGTAAVSALVGALTGGLVGFGIGSSHGGLLGSLAGAGTGALAGLMVGGPIGAVVGGLIGLLGGIFGGIFGGAKRKKQANALADNTIIPDITQIVTGFDGFQVDQSSAIQQLEQLRTDAQKQLSALKSQGKDVFNQKVGPAIDSAEKHIRDTQAERDRRSSLVFGPPQFDTGGLFRTMRGNAGLAVLHDGEMVINPTATKKNAAALSRINAGGTVGSHIEVHIHPDAFDRHYVKSQQFEKDITTALNRASAEGRW